MKNILTVIIVVAIFTACSSNTKKTDAKSFEKGITEILTTYPNNTDKLEIKYDEWNRIQTILNGDKSITIEYNKNDDPIKLMSYYNNELEFSETIESYTDSLHIIKSEIEDNKPTQTYKETYIYNDDKEMTGIFRYKKDSMGNWKKRGSKYEFYWKDGNLMTVKNFIPAEITISDSIRNYETENHSILELDEISDQLIEDGYTLFYESTYTYDNKKNPYVNTSISQLILPNLSNISKNNPIRIEKIYPSGETILQNFSNTYNENDFLISSLIKVTMPLEDSEYFEITREFKY